MTSIPASHTRPLDAASMVLVVLICLTWGFNQPAIKLAIHDVPPLTQCAIRSALATLMVLGIMRLRGLPIAARDGSLTAGLVAGALFGLEFLLIYRGLLYTTASRARAVHLSGAILCGDRRALVLSGRSFQRDAVAWAVDGICRHVGGVRCTGAGVLAGTNSSAI